MVEVIATHLEQADMFAKSGDACDGPICRAGVDHKDIRLHSLGQQHIQLLGNPTLRIARWNNDGILHAGTFNSPVFSVSVRVYI